MVGSIFQKFSLAVVFGRLKTTGWIAFILLGILPFFGVIFLSWEPSIILAGYFADRIIYLLFYFLTDVIMFTRSGKFTGTELGKKVFSALVSIYIMLQFFALIADIAGIFTSQEMLNELISLTAAIFLLYGIQFVLSLKQIKPSEWKSDLITQYGRMVFLSGAIFMISFVGGVFLVPIIRDSFLSSFFVNGYGIIIFMFTILRMASDMIFFMFSGQGSITNSSP